MKENWILRKISNTKFTKPIMIEGLPGMGNVGKIAVDFIVESLKAKKVYEINSYDFANCVFVNEEGIPELPKVEIYHKKRDGNDLFLVSGDVQPSDERGCYEFCENLLELFKEEGGKEVLSLGGMGLETIPKNPKIYCIGSEKAIMKNYKVSGVKEGVGIIGPIMGVSGLLIGLARKHGVKGATLLVETYGHPTYLGLKEARELLKVLNEKFKLKLDMKSLDKEVKVIEKEIKDKIEKLLPLQEEKGKKKDFTNYIG